MNSDMKIVGSGKILAGEYNKVILKGKVHLYGIVKCVSFSSSGTVKGDDIECSEKFRTYRKPSETAKICRINTFNC